MSISFLLFACSMYFVYADANSDVLNKRNEIDVLKNDIINKRNLVNTLESEREYWENRLTDSKNYLEEKEDLEKIAKDLYDSAVSKKVESAEDIEEIERLKTDLTNKQNEVASAQTNVEIAQEDLASFEQRLLNAKNELREMENSLPDEEELLDDLIDIANKAVPARIGTTNNILISIVLSDTCLISEDCPDYNELAKIYDNSNRHISGDFEYVDSGKTRAVYEFVACEGNCSNEGEVKKVGDEPIMIWQRQQPIFGQATVEWYQNNPIPVITFVDPDDTTRERSKQIIIEPTLPEGFDKVTAMENNTISYGVDRKIDGCHSAVIGWKPYGDELLADTWNYFYNNCSEETSMVDTISQYLEPTPFTGCHSHCEYINWVNNAKQMAKEILIEGLR